MSLGNEAADIRCVQYFDGITTFEEIVFRTGLSRRELDRISHIFRDDVSRRLVCTDTSSS